MRRTQDTKLIAEAHAYVAKLYREVMGWTVADLGTQNQVCDFILADPELCRAVARWAKDEQIGEASTKPRRMLPHDALYHRVRSRFSAIIEPPSV